MAEEARCLSAKQGGIQLQENDKAFCAVSIQGQSGCWSPGEPLLEQQAWVLQVPARWSTMWSTRWVRWWHILYVIICVNMNVASQCVLQSGKLNSLNPSRMRYIVAMVESTINMTLVYKRTPYMQIKEFSKRAKKWRNDTWPKDSGGEGRPSSYLMSLLVVLAYREATPTKKPHEWASNA